MTDEAILALRNRAFKVSDTIDLTRSSVAVASSLGDVVWQDLSNVQKVMVVVTTYNLIVYNTDVTGQEIVNLLSGWTLFRDSFNYQLLAYAQQMNPSKNALVVDSNLFPLK